MTIFLCICAAVAVILAVVFLYAILETVVRTSLQVQAILYKVDHIYDRICRIKDQLNKTKHTDGLQ